MKEACTDVLWPMMPISIYILYTGSTDHPYNKDSNFCNKVFSLSFMHVCQVGTCATMAKLSPMPQEATVSIYLTLLHIDFMDEWRRSTAEYLCTN